MANPPHRPRRRIAGERRDSRSAADAAPVSRPTEQEPPPPDQDSAVLLDKPPEAPERAKAPRQARGRRAAWLRRQPSESPSGWWGSTTSLVALGAALVVLVTLVVLGALGLLGNDGYQDLSSDDDVRQATETAPQAAERAASAILSYDYRTLEADRDAATRFMTGDLADQYTDTFDRVVSPAAEDTRARVSAKVQAASVVRAGEDQVRVLLFVDQTTRSNANTQPQLALNRVELIMVRDGDSWLVDEITSY